METLNNIENLRNELRVTETTTSKERQQIVKLCRELYNVIEEGLYNKHGEGAVLDAHKDLIEGDFSEGYNCEIKKQKFELYAKIYVENIATEVEEVEVVEESEETVLNFDSEREFKRAFNTVRGDKRENQLKLSEIKSINGLEVNISMYDRAITNITNQKIESFKNEKEIYLLTAPFKVVMK